MIFSLISLYTSPSRWKWAAVSHRSLASWSIKRLSPPVQLLLVSMICTVPVIDQLCDSICKWFRIAQLAVSVCSQGFQFPAAIVDQLVHERWKNGIFHRSRLPRWRGRRNLIKIGEVSLSGGPSNQLDDKWSPFRSNGSFEKMSGKHVFRPDRNSMDSVMVHVVKFNSNWKKKIILNKLAPKWPNCRCSCF